MGFIGDRIGAQQAGGGAAWCSAIVEFENELGSTSSDKYFQGQAYYGLVCAGNCQAVARLYSSFPTFLIEIQGPYLQRSRGICTYCLISHIWNCLGAITC